MFNNRTYTPELLDGENIPYDDLAQTLKELNYINKNLGGHAITLNALKKLITDKNKTYEIIDIGCGGGDNLIAMAKWAREKGIKINFTGIDLKPEAITYAKSFCAEYTEIKFICDDYKNAMNYLSSFDVAVTSLFCHHFPEKELIELFKWQHNNAKIGFVVNDLHRHWLAYYLIKFLTKTFSKSYLVINDAPLSVARGFKKTELINLITEAGISNYQIHWKWAFRYQIITYK